MAAGLMVADHRQHHLAAIRDWLSRPLAYPFQWAVQAPLAGLDARCANRSRPSSRVEADNVKLAVRQLRAAAQADALRVARAGEPAAARRARELGARRAAHADRRDRARRPRSVPAARAGQQGHARRRVPRPGGARRERHLRPGHARRPGLRRSHPDLRSRARDPGAGESHRRAQHRARHRPLGPAVAALPAAERRRRSSATCS